MLDTILIIVFAVGIACIVTVIKMARDNKKELEDIHIQQAVHSRK